jgi:hypothetical protein
VDDEEHGYPVQGQLLWWRGPSKVQGEYLILDANEAESFLLDTQTGAGDDLAFDLAAIDSVESAREFVAKWGMLRTGPDGGRISEPVADLIGEGQRVRTILTMYADLLHYVGGEPAESDLDRWRTVLPQMGVKGDPEPTDLAEVAAALVNDSLGSTPLAVVVNPAFGSEGEAPFLASIGATDLLGFAYFHVATLVMGSTPLRACEMCGRPFEVKHPRQRYCSERCGTRARQRRFAAKKEERS